MKKLITLVDFSFKTGDQVYQEKRLVLVEIGPRDTAQWMLDKSVALIENWFPVHYPQSKLLSVIAHETISENNDPIPMTIPRITTQIPAKEPAVFNAAFTSDQLPPKQPGSSDSDMVLVDETGAREFFNIWFYDHFNKNWIEASSGVEVEEETLKTMRWMYLPLAKYDK